MQLRHAETVDPAQRKKTASPVGLGSAHVINRATAFAHVFDSEFKSRTAGLSPNEIPLFRALHGALVAAGTRFAVEEYHGSSYQVSFSGNGSYARVNARCELSDLLIVVFTRIPPAARMTYLQAKSERRAYPYGCGQVFAANLEQWFLLRNRPQIAGFGAFNPPADLLSNAILPSVGSFAFFHASTNGPFEIYYASAAHLQPPKNYSQRYGSLTPLGKWELLSVLRSDGPPDRPTSGQLGAKNIIVIKSDYRPN